MTEPKTGAEWLDATCHDADAFGAVLRGIFEAARQVKEENEANE